MAKFSRQAVQVRQGNLTLYLTYVTPRELFNEDFYRVEALDADKRTGFQRVLKQARAKKLARHLNEANPYGYAHLPTTVFLATEKDLQYNPNRGLLEFEPADVCPFSVVDGQHRIEGLRRAIDSSGQGDASPLWSFQLPVTVATGLDATHQMYHFYIVNTQQERVEKSLDQQITREFEDMEGIEELPYLPHWLSRQVQQGRDSRAILIAEALNTNSGSPIRGRIQMANENPIPFGIKQSSLVNTIKSEVISSANPLAGQEPDAERQARIMVNYMQAIDELLVAGRDRTKTRLYNNNGLFFSFAISRWVFNDIYSTTRNCSVDSLKSCLKKGFDALEEAGDDMATYNPDWWISKESHSLNRGSARQLVARFQEALLSTSRGASII